MRSDEGRAMRRRYAGPLAVGAVLASYCGAIPVLMLARGRGDWADVAAALVIAIWFGFVFRSFRRRIEGQAPRELSARGAAAELAVGLGIGLALFSAIVALIAALGGYRVVGYNPAAVLVPVAAMAILSGVTEEIVFRGYLFRLTERWLGTWWALAISAGVFGALHLGNANATPLAGVAIMLEAGIMLAAIFLLTRRLWAPIGVHAAWNFAQGGIYGIPVSGGATAGVLRPHIAGPAWLTGGAFGAEASLPAILVATAFGLVLLGAAHRRGRFLPPAWRRADQPAGEQA